MAKRPATRNQPSIKEDLTQEKVDETIAELRQNGATEDIVETVKKVLAKHIKSTDDDAAVKDALRPSPYVDDLSDGDKTDEYDEATGELVVKRRRLTDKDEGATTSKTAPKKRVKGESKNKRETTKKKHGKDEPRVRIISPPIKNIGPNRKTYFKIMEETAKDNVKIQELWNKFGHLIRKAKLRIAKELFRSKNKNEDKKHKNKPHFRLPWIEVLAFFKPREVLMYNLLAENYRYNQDRHYMVDGNASTRWDKHPYGLKRYIYEGAFICEPDEPSTWCDYCHDMTPAARRERWNHYQNIIVNPDTIGEPSSWTTLAQKIQTPGDCMRELQEKGLMYEFIEHPDVRSFKRMPTKNYEQYDVGTQTYIAAAITAVDLESEEWRNKKIFTDLTDGPKPGNYTLILNPNIHCERFVDPTTAMIYMNMVKVEKEFDPGRFAYSRIMTMALKALEEKRCREYEEVMKNREQLLTLHADESARARIRMLRRDPMLEAFIDEYFTPETRHTAARVMGRSTLEVRVSRPDELPALPKYDKPPILEFRFDGQPFDATKYTDDELLRYHLYWANFYESDHNRRAQQYVPPEVLEDPDIAAEQYARATGDLPIDTTSGVETYVQTTQTIEQQAPEQATAAAAMESTGTTTTYQEQSSQSPVLGTVVVKQEPAHYAEYEDAANEQAPEQEQQRAPSADLGMTTAITATPPAPTVSDAAATETQQREVEVAEPTMATDPATEAANAEVEGDGTDETNATTRAPARAQAPDEIAWLEEQRRYEITRRRLENLPRYMRPPMIPNMTTPEAALKPAARPSPALRTLAQEILMTAQMLAKHNPTAAAIEASRIKEEKTDTGYTDDDDSKCLHYLKWEYDERYVGATKYLAAQNSFVTALKLSQAPHPKMEPTEQVFHQTPAIIGIVAGSTRDPIARLKEIARHLREQNIDEWQEFDMYPTSNVNTSPYMSKESLVPPIPYKIMEDMRDIVVGNSKEYENSSFTNRDVMILESLIKLLFSIMNLNMTATLELMRIWKMNTTEAIDAKDMLVDTCRKTAMDAQKAVCEALIHVVVTRRLRNIKRHVRMDKDDVVKLLTGELKQISLY